MLNNPVLNGWNANHAITGLTLLGEENRVQLAEAIGLIAKRLVYKREMFINVFFKRSKCDIPLMIFMLEATFFLTSF